MMQNQLAHSGPEQSSCAAYACFWSKFPFSFQLRGSRGVVICMRAGSDRRMLLGMARPRHRAVMLFPLAPVLLCSGSLASAPAPRSRAAGLLHPPRTRARLPQADNDARGRSSHPYPPLTSAAFGLVRAADGRMLRYRGCPDGRARARSPVTQEAA